MASLRIFARSFISPSRHFYNNLSTNKYTVSSITYINKRFASFKSSPVYDETKKYTDYEISRDPVEWSYVTRLFRPKYIPVPPKNIEVTASGWRPQIEEAKKLPYFVNRTKNHLQPVYLVRKNRNIRRITSLGKIDGDIVALEADLRKYIEEKTGKKVGSQISEPGGIIKFRGDYVNLIKKWLDEHGL